MGQPTYALVIQMSVSRLLDGLSVLLAQTSWARYSEPSLAL